STTGGTRVRSPDARCGRGTCRLPARTDSGYASGFGAFGSVCQRPNLLPSGSGQGGTQPIDGTGIGSPASPPSSLTRAAPVLMSSTSKYTRAPRASSSAAKIAPPWLSENRVMRYSLGPGYDSNCQPKSEPQNALAFAVSPAGNSTWTIWPAIVLSSRRLWRRPRPIIQ